MLPQKCFDCINNNKQRKVDDEKRCKNKRIIMAERQQNLQDAFLNQVRKQKIPLTIFLVNGVKLNGVVSWFDNFCVLLKRDGIAQLVYKHAISTIMPSDTVNLGPEDDGEETD